MRVERGNYGFGVQSRAISHVGGIPFNKAFIRTGLGGGAV